MKINCSYTKLVPIEELVKHPKNPNTHTPRQIELLAKIIKMSGFRSPIVISKRSGFIVKGHGRLQSAIKAGLKEVPVDIQEYESEAEEYADMIADNRIAELSEMNSDTLLELIGELGEMDYDLDLTGFEEYDIDQLMNGVGEEEKKEEKEGGYLDIEYTQKIKAPNYEIKGDQPNIDELYQTEKYDSLITEIEKSNLSEDQKKFLKISASRHIVFNYEKIAEYYAHQEKEAQGQMEDSALVVIDFDKAIEKGFGSFSEEMRKYFAQTPTGANPVPLYSEDEE
jgi:ParB-like chromosome segregation protein Spo0J